MSAMNIVRTDAEPATGSPTSAPEPPRVEQPDRRTVLELAALAECDPRTAARALRGERVIGLAGERIRRVIARWSEPTELGPR
jgi:hypothetical protein